MYKDEQGNPPRDIEDLISAVKSSVTMNINAGVPEEGRRCNIG